MKLLFLHFYRLGNIFTDLQYTFRIRIKTVKFIVQDVCTTIWSELSEIYMKILSKNEWFMVANNLEVLRIFHFLLKSHRR